uniref:Chromodomain helicase DNA binding protein 9 n=1 Tax=Lepisosteus oculatus TaxID=7918 RepID=W5MK45_LEPOC
MDFFDDPSLFVGGLDGLSDEGFAGSGPVSLVDELNLGAEFEPLQVEPLGGGKHPGMAPPPASASSQAGLPFEQQLGQFDVLKGPLPLGQPFSLAEGGAAGGGRNALHPQYHSSPVHQPPQPNGLFPDSSPMWGNQEQSGNVFHQPAPSQSSQLGQQQHQQHHHHHHHHHHHLPQPQYMSSQPGQPPTLAPRFQSRVFHQHKPGLIHREKLVRHEACRTGATRSRYSSSAGTRASNPEPASHEGRDLPVALEGWRTLASPDLPVADRRSAVLFGFCCPSVRERCIYQQPKSGTLFSCSFAEASYVELSISVKKHPQVHALRLLSYSSAWFFCAVSFVRRPCWHGRYGLCVLHEETCGCKEVMSQPGALVTAAPYQQGAAAGRCAAGHQVLLSCSSGLQFPCPGTVSYCPSQDGFPTPSLCPARSSLGPLHSVHASFHTQTGCSLSVFLLSGYWIYWNTVAPFRSAQGEVIAFVEADWLCRLSGAREYSFRQKQEMLCVLVDNLAAFTSRGKKSQNWSLIVISCHKTKPFKNTNGSSGHTRVLSPQLKSGTSSSSSSSSSSSEKRQKKKPLMEQALEDKQEKANRIISEAIAKARERGEKNIPRVMSPESFPCSSTPPRQDHKPHHAKAPPTDPPSRKAKGPAASRSKQKTKIGKIVIKFGKKKKRKTESSEELSDTEPLPRRCSKDDDSKRRSNRQVKRKKYAEEGECKVSDEEVKVIVKAKKTASGSRKEQPVQLFVENPSEEDAAVVDKIMSSRIGKKEVSPGVVVEVEEFYVKYKNYSYLHCEWATEQQLVKDKRIQQKIKRFKIKQAQRAHFFADMEEEPFNPDYVEVDRVLEVSYCKDKDTGEPVVYYLVKWCSLPYEDSTWELKEDVDQSKIEEFEQLQAARPDPRRVERPPASMWKKTEQSREYRNGNRLRDYQLEGVNWLLFNWYNRRNCILADEMGLGKTIQSITFLEEIFLTGIRGPFLIIAPLSTIANWEREFRTWTDLNVIVYHGSMVSRQMLQQYEMYFRDSQGRVIRGAYKFHAIVTTFEMILGGCPELNAIEWRCVIIDEAHRLKNKNCKLLEGFKLMSLEHKVLLTGTPLQNTVEELFSLLHFLEPLRFPSESTFMQEFGDLKTEEQVQKLQAILKPMMLRRLKEDVEKKLAPKEETIIEVELTNIQKKYYRAILEKNFSFLSKGAGQANVPNLVNTMMELRKCCNHPYLIKGAEEKILEEFREVHNPAALDFHLQAMVQSAGKLVLIDKLLPKMKAGGHKVLIFSQMVRCLDILEDYLIQRRYLYERIDGRVRGNLRQAAIDRFSKPDSDRFVFLLCTRAGGLGINLTAADTCIIFDSDWNPQNDLQAQARCHRIGQNKAVKVYRLITRNSYEREMFDRASLKLGLDKAVLQSMSGRENSVGGVIQQLSKKEIEDLLRRGAYGAIMDEEDEGSKFCEEDIDQILQRRTKTITIESEGRGSTFAKASFVASGNRTDISLDDPNFWDKWAKKAEIDLDTINGRNSLVIDTPRVRKQTRPFSATKDELAELSEPESEGDDKPKLRRPYDRLNGYGRTECFRVEKNLLVYGWGRWKDILLHGRFKRQLNEHDVEIICRALLAYCLVHYRGDDKIKSFMWDLIAPTEDGQTKELQNHLGLSAPVPRGRKGKKVKTQPSSFDIQKAEWIRKHNPEHLLQDDGYKKHLKHHCNKVLLRVRMLYYLKQEVIGDQSQKVLDGVDSSETEIWVPEPDHSELPAHWWDTEADKSLLIGVYKHGYEKYNTIRADPALIFLERVGRPDDKAIAAEQRANDFMDGDGDDPEYKPAPALLKDDIEDDASSPGDLVIADGGGDLPPEGGMLMEGDALYWPPPSALTTRLRRLITAYQRNTKNRQIQHIQQALPAQPSALLSTLNDNINPKIAAKIERQQRWTRREEADFYRVVSTFGVVFDPEQGRFDWTKFRAMARLHKKTDDSLQKYLCAFTAMCRRVCRLPPREGESVDPSISIQPITEERASRTLYRIELLRKVREQVLRHPQLYERLQLCQPGPDLPVWWEPGAHDRDLLIGAAKHGVSRTDYHILRDPELCFMTAQSNYSQNKGAQSRTPTPLLLPQYQAMVAGSPLAAQPRPPDPRTAQVEEPRQRAEHLKEEPPTSEEEGAERKGKAEQWSPRSGAQTQGLVDSKAGGQVKGESERRSMVAARTEPLTPNSVAKKQKRGSKRGRRQGRRASCTDSDTEQDSDSDREDRKASALIPLTCSEISATVRSGRSVIEENFTHNSILPSIRYDAIFRRIDYLKEIAEAAKIKGFDEDSVASLSTTQDETQDSFLTDNGLHSSSHAFQGGYMLAASYWPKDRVMINRLDSICQAVLKGAWPAARRGYEGSAVSSFYTTKLLDSPSDQGGPPGPREDPAQSPQMSKVKKHVREKEFTVKINDQEGSLKLTFQKQGLPQKRPLEGEDGPLGQQQYLARLRELQSASDTSLADFTKPLPTAAAVSPGAAGPVRANGALDGQPVVKKRRGRRKNVEGMDLLFLNKNRSTPDHVGPGVGGSAQASPAVVPGLGYGPSQAPVDTESRVPVINLKDGTRLAGDDAPKKKDLEQWLKEHPGYVADVGAFIPPLQGLNKMTFQDGRPRQKRHRCRNPNKIDINSLTGEERVQIINRRNARKVGGAFAPPLKDLCRFLKENPEYGVPPEWADVVKRSGFLPESMFDRILTGPIVREEVSRRGRRPKSEMAKAAAAAANASAATLSINPLLSNGLLSGMDLSSLQALQQNLQSLQSLHLTAGLMGLPGGLAAAGDANNLAAMFPMMLSGMAGLPNLLGMGGLLGKPQEGAGVSEDGTKKGNGGSGDSSSSASKTPVPTDTKGERTEGQGADQCPSDPSTSGATAPLSASAVAAAAASSNHPLALNPLLLSSMLYPGMLLTPGLNLPISALSQSGVFDAQQQSTSARPAATASGETPRGAGGSTPAKGQEPGEQKENSAEEGSEKAGSSSSESEGSSSSSEDSDSSNED